MQPSARGSSSRDVTVRDLRDLPYYVGQRLWISETFALEQDVDGDAQEPPHGDGRPVKRIGNNDDGFGWLQPHYRATDPPPDLVIVDKNGDEQCGVKWRPPIHMPRWASRITLAVESIRVERLQEITEDDARAEGVSAIPGQDFWSCFCEATHDSFDMTVEPDAEYRREHGITHVKHVPAVPTPARVVRARLWDQTHAKRPGCSWADNPYVWVVGFRRVP